MRHAFVDQIDRKKAIEYFKQTQGWSKAEVIAQVLTPIEDVALINPTAADPNSIMCYQIPGTITKSGKPIIGGLDIDASDYAYAARLYPKPSQRPAAAATAAAVLRDVGDLDRVRSLSGRRRSGG
jgi:hypothetical protein